MGILLIGIVMLACIVGLFWLKNQTRKPWIARLAYSAPVARLTVGALALIIVGIIVTIGKLFE